MNSYCNRDTYQSKSEFDNSSWDIPIIVISVCVFLFVAFVAFISYQRIKNIFTIVTNITNPSSMNLTANWPTNNQTEVWSVIPTLGVTTNWTNKSNQPIGISTAWSPTQSANQTAVNIIDQSSIKKPITDQSIMRMNIF